MMMGFAHPTQSIALIEILFWVVSGIHLFVCSNVETLKVFKSCRSWRIAVWVCRRKGRHLSRLSSLPTNWLDWVEQLTLSDLVWESILTYNHQDRCFITNRDRQVRGESGVSLLQMVVVWQRRRPPLDFFPRDSSVLDRDPLPIGKFWFLCEISEAWCGTKNVWPTCWKVCIKSGSFLFYSSRIQVSIINLMLLKLLEKQSLTSVMWLSFCCLSCPSPSSLSSLPVIELVFSFIIYYYGDKSYLTTDRGQLIFHYQSS